MHTVPHGFAARAESGLLVPIEQSRDRQVWTRDEWRLLDRATKMLKRHGIGVLLQCQHAKCQEKPIESERLLDGGFRLRCAHADRVLQSEF